MYKSLDKYYYILKYDLGGLDLPERVSYTVNELKNCFSVETLAKELDTLNISYTEELGNVLKSFEVKGSILSLKMPLKLCNTALIGKALQYIISEVYPDTSCTWSIEDLKAACDDPNETALYVFGMTVGKYYHFIKYDSSMDRTITNRCNAVIPVKNTKVISQAIRCYLEENVPNVSPEVKAKVEEFTKANHFTNDTFFSMFVDPEEKMLLLNCVDPYWKSVAEALQFVMQFEDDENLEWTVFNVELSEHTDIWEIKVSRKDISIMQLDEDYTNTI